MVIARVRCPGCKAVMRLPSLADLAKLMSTLREVPGAAGVALLCKQCGHTFPVGEDTEILPAQEGR